MPEEKDDKPREQPPLAPEEIEQIVASANEGGPFWKHQWGCLLLVIWVTAVLVALVWALSRIRFPWDYF